MAISRIKRVRELRRITQRYMAGQLGITQSTYSRIEAGTITPGRERMRRIAGLLDVTVEELMGSDPLLLAVEDRAVSGAVADRSVMQHLAQRLSLLIEEHQRALETDQREREAMRELMRDYLERRRASG